MSKRTELLEDLTSEKTERDPNQLYFCCPECGHSALIWVQQEVTIYTDVDCVSRSGEVQFGAEDRDELSADYFFECGHCEYSLMDNSGNSIESPQELAEWRHIVLPRHGSSLATNSSSPNGSSCRRSAFSLHCKSRYSRSA